jgi:hypothetical protein
MKHIKLFEAFLFRDPNEVIDEISTEVDKLEEILNRDDLTKLGNGALINLKQRESHRYLLEFANSLKSVCIKISKIVEKLDYEYLSIINENIKTLEKILNSLDKIMLNASNARMDLIVKQQILSDIETAKKYYYIGKRFVDKEIYSYGPVINNDVDTDEIIRDMGF